MFLDLFLDKHKQEADKQECTGKPDGAHAKTGNQMSADACTNGE